jgi:hypothetical protein
VPAVSVVLPVYRGEQYVSQSIVSVLDQAFSDFFLVVINDGSDDSSDKIICSIVDSRLRYFSQSNHGLAATLNKGIELSTGRYVARQDQDDLMLAGRLGKQVEFLDRNPDCAMVGTWAQIYSGHIPTQRYHRHPRSNEALQLELLFDNPFVHSSMMIRADVLREVGGYCEDKSRQPPEDYELWSRIARKHRVANIPEVLTVYREVEGSMSRTGENPFLSNVIRIASENLADVLVPAYSAEQCYALAALYHGRNSAEDKEAFSLGLALEMHQRAARAVGGEMAKWSDEFRASFSRQRAHIASSFVQRRLPRVLLGPARRIKHFLVSRFGHAGKGA